MRLFLHHLRRRYLDELPVIRLYFLFYFLGVILGCLSVILLKERFTGQTALLFDADRINSFSAVFLQQLMFFLLVFILGLTVIGISLIPLFPLYKGFSIGLLISLSTVFSGVRGLFFGTLAFFAQNFLYTLLGYFICVSSARLSISFLELLRGRGKHGTPYREFILHFKCFLFLLPALALGALWEIFVVPLLLKMI